MGEMGEKPNRPKALPRLRREKYTRGKSSKANVLNADE